MLSSAHKHSPLTPPFSPTSPITRWRPGVPGCAPQPTNTRLSEHRLAFPTSLAGAPAHLGDLMGRVDGGKQRSVIQHMSKDLIPIMEKGLVDCPLVHR